MWKQIKHVLQSFNERKCFRNARFIIFFVFVCCLHLLSTVVLFDFRGCGDQPKWSSVDRGLVARPSHCMWMLGGNLHPLFFLSKTNDDKPGKCPAKSLITCICLGFVLERVFIFSAFYMATGKTMLFSVYLRLFLKKKIKVWSFPIRTLKNEFHFNP